MTRRKPKGRFTVFMPDRRPLAVYASMHFRFAKSAKPYEVMERIHSPRQFIRAYESKQNKDWYFLKDGVCYTVNEVKITRSTASVLIYLGAGYVQHVGSSIPSL